MPLLTELAVLSPNVFYKDVAPPELLANFQICFARICFRTGVSNGALISLSASMGLNSAGGAAGNSPGRESLCQNSLERRGIDELKRKVRKVQRKGRRKKPSLRSFAGSFASFAFGIEA